MLLVGWVGREIDVGDDRMRDAEVNVELLKLLEVPGVGGLGAEVWGSLNRGASRVHRYRGG